MAEYLVKIPDGETDCEELEDFLRHRTGCNVIVVAAPEKPHLYDMLPKTIGRETMSKLIEGIYFTAGKRGRVWTAQYIYKKIFNYLTTGEK